MAVSYTHLDVYKRQLLFPLFIFTYAIAMVYAVFTNIEWKPIQHKVALSVEDLNDTTKK